MKYNSFLPTNCYFDLKTIEQKNSSPIFFNENFVDKLLITRKSCNTILDKKEISICLEFLGKTSL